MPPLCPATRRHLTTHLGPRAPPTIQSPPRSSISSMHHMTGGRRTTRLYYTSSILPAPGNRLATSRDGCMKIACQLPALQTFHSTIKTINRRDPSLRDVHRSISRPQSRTQIVARCSHVTHRSWIGDGGSVWRPRATGPYEAGLRDFPLEYCCRCSEEEGRGKRKEAFENEDENEGSTSVFHICSGSQ